MVVPGAAAPVQKTLTRTAQRPTLLCASLC